MTVKGIDVSSYQSSSYSTAGLSFVFVKATQSTNYVNPKMAAQAKRARDAGAVVGFYHFQVAGNVQAQAEYFVERCASKAGDILACDWETDPSTGKHPSNAEKDAFIKAVKKLRPDHKVVLYCNLSSWKGIDKTSYVGDGLWIADPSAPAGKPRVTAQWLFHQYGIQGTDVNVANFKDKAALKAWATGDLDTPTEPKPSTPKPTTPAPKPKPPFPGASFFGPGKNNAHITALGKQLVKKGYGKHYKTGPGPKWTDADHDNVRAFQLSQAQLKGDPDGIPGPLTWKILFS